MFKNYLDIEEGVSVILQEICWHSIECYFYANFVCLGYFVGYKWLYPLYLSNPPDWKIYIVPALIIVGVSIGAIVLITLLVKASIINSGYFSKVEQRQVLARMIIDNGYYTKKQVKSSDGKTREKSSFQNLL